MFMIYFGNLVFGDLLILINWKLLHILEDQNDITCYTFRVVVDISPDI